MYLFVLLSTYPNIAMGIGASSGSVYIQCPYIICKYDQLSIASVPFLAIYTSNVDRGLFIIMSYCRGDGTSLANWLAGIYIYLCSKHSMGSTILQSAASLLV